MKITKYEHACLVVEDNGKRLVVDPGMYAKSLQDYSNIVAVVITHVHSDHFDPKQIGAIASANPNVQIFTTGEVAAELKNHSATVVKAGDTQQAAPFTLQFFGGEHAFIHGSYPKQQNVGVLVNNTLYYPGDSFTRPDVPVKVLAVPADAPWMKVGEAMDFLAEVKAGDVLPTHNIFLSELGSGLTDRLLSSVVQPAGGTYHPLAVGESLEVN
jgi:L-ascorbate metabolism protein UlaG (beta-lactamase superfamily)